MPRFTLVKPTPGEMVGRTFRETVLLGELWYSAETRAVVHQALDAVLACLQAERGLDHMLFSGRDDVDEIPERVAKLVDGAIKRRNMSRVFAAGRVELGLVRACLTLREGLGPIPYMLSPLLETAGRFANIVAANATRPGAATR